MWKPMERYGKILLMYKILDDCDYENGQRGIRLLKGKKRIFIPYTGKGRIWHGWWNDYEDEFFRHCVHVANSLWALRVNYDVRVYKRAYYPCINRNGGLQEFSTEYISLTDMPYNNYQFHPFDEKQRKPLDREVAQELRTLYLAYREK